jgi:hypothetical protein
MRAQAFGNISIYKYYIISMIIYVISTLLQPMTFLEMHKSYEEDFGNVLS